MFCIVASLSPFAEWPFMLQGKVGKLPEKVVSLEFASFALIDNQSKRCRRSAVTD